MYFHIYHKVIIDKIKKLIHILHNKANFSLNYIMDTNFIISKNLKLLKVANIDMPQTITQFGVNSFNEFNITVASNDGAVDFTTITNNSTPISSNESLKLIKCDSNTYFIDKITPIIVSKTLWQGTVTIGESVHNITFLMEGKQKIIVECEPVFFAETISKDNFINATAFGNYLLLQFSKRIILLQYSTTYQKIFECDCDLINITADRIDIFQDTKTVEGYQKQTSLTLSAEGQLIETPFPVNVLRKNNYTDKTFSVVFFERIRYLSDLEIARSLTNSFDMADIPKLREFLGIFSSAEKYGEYTALYYPDNIRVFSLELKNSLVDNVVEL